MRKNKLYLKIGLKIANYQHKFWFEIYNKILSLLQLGVFPTHLCNTLVFNQLSGKMVSGIREQSILPLKQNVHGIVH